MVDCAIRFLCPCIKSVDWGPIVFAYICFSVCLQNALILVQTFEIVSDSAFIFHMRIFVERLFPLGPRLRSSAKVKVKYHVTFHYLPLDGMINIPIYLVWGCWVQLNSTNFCLQIT